MTDYKIYCPICGFKFITDKVTITNKRIKIETDITTGKKFYKGLETGWDTEIYCKCPNCQNLLHINVHGKKMIERCDDE